MLVGVGQLSVGTLGESGDGGLEAARAGIGGERERATLPTCPQLCQRGRQQGQGAWRSERVIDESVRKTDVQEQARARGGSFDGASQLGCCGGADQQGRVGGRLGQLRVVTQVADVVGAERDHDRGGGVGLDQAEQRRDEGLALRGVVTHGPELLELVNDDDGSLAWVSSEHGLLQQVGHPVRTRVAPAQRDPDELTHGVRARSHDPEVPALAARQGTGVQPGQQPCADERGLAAARGADHRDEALARDPGEGLRDQALTTDEPRRVAGVVRRQTHPRALVGMRAFCVLGSMSKGRDSLADVSTCCIELLLHHLGPRDRTAHSSSRVVLRQA